MTHKSLTRKGPQHVPVSRVVLLPGAVQKLKASPPVMLWVRGMCAQVRASTLHQGSCLSPPGFAHPALPLNWHTCPVMGDV